jgi:YjbE family integral membrane protein
MDSLLAQAPQFLEILWLNIILSGDNAVVIGLAAAGLPEHMRAKAVLFGIITAAVLRIIFSIFATFLLTLWWIDIVGGAALLYIAWGFYKELRGHGEGEDEDHGEAKEKTLPQALWQIIVADVSMSLDNVLAVAAVARNNLPMLIIGLLISIVLMGVLGGFLAKLLDRYKIIAWIGLALIAWIGIELLWEGAVIANATLELGLPLPAPHAAADH